MFGRFKENTYLCTRQLYVKRLNSKYYAKTE